ncbi:uncharacterized protein K452DRAFT_282083 [Aplosporella prunicola CBS 121167]|uniref:Uncharacterized protein n=1 Tax=Aplosporella prunicola CBS 121167 TaxID=1176127 RepID=A0A6A6BW34_9PEZI|nr:uncharacterized protein K452DRAFT_282083 [Aplosporella prunicola CBS 121167]KAF2147097.1 hypothetical protein K452DRAFT_282083 [Aplosporella prunicola CBS 121167]
MYTSRAAIRSTRALRARPLRTVRNARFQSTSSGQAEAGFHPAFAGAAAGLVGGFAGAYGLYHFSGTRDIVKKSQQAKSYLDSGINKIKENTPEPNEALQYLRQTAVSYAAFIPGAKQYVNAAFDDLDTIRGKHGDEVDKIVREAYTELQKVAQGGANLETAYKAWDVIQKHLKRVGELAGDAAQDIINNHPELKEKLGGRLDQLKQMGDQYGPEAKKQVDQTWEQIQDIVKSGISADSADKIRKLVQEKVELVKKMGDEAWKKGMEQAKPYLDKNPKVKEIVEQNADALKQGDLSGLWEQVRSATESGDTGKLKDFINEQTDKAKKSGFGGLDQYLNKIPGGDQLLPKLGQLQEIANKHGKEAEQLLRDTIDELSQVLNKKSEDAKKIAEKASKDAK